MSDIAHARQCSFGTGVILNWTARTTMADTAGKTGLGPTVIVAIEQNVPEPQRIVVDDLAPRILPLGSRTLVWLLRSALLRDWMIRATERSLPGVWAGMLVRKRYIDEKLVQAASRMDAVVNLGAGFDTRIYRLPLGDTQAWEVDLPANIEAKGRQLRKIVGGIHAHVKLCRLTSVARTWEPYWRRTATERT